MERVTDASSKVIITADGGFRRGEVVKLKDNVDEACKILAANGNPVRNVICVQHCDNHVAWDHSRDLWWHDMEISSVTDCPCEPMDSEDMLFLLYTSGSTGKPKGILHTTGGYLLYTTVSAKYVFTDLQRAGLLVHGGCGVGDGALLCAVRRDGQRRDGPDLRGAPNMPGNDRFWDIIERHRVTRLYTAADGNPGLHEVG